MDILGIGPLELVFILIIALIVLGPKDMVKAGKTIGRALRAIVTSDTWRIVQQATREVRTLPNRLIREAGIDELQKQLPNPNTIEKDLGLNEIGKSIQKSASADLSDWTTPPSASNTLEKPIDPKSLRPAQEGKPEESLEEAGEAGDPPDAPSDAHTDAGPDEEDPGIQGHTQQDNDPS